MLKGNILFSFAGYFVFAIFLSFLPSNQTEQNDFPERVKIAMREVGNQLLLADKDSTSLVLPILQKENHTYELSFEKSLEIVPDDLLLHIEKTFQKSNLPKNYRVELLQCSDGEVAYSYAMKNTEEESIIPCKGRTLPKACYTVKVHFIENTTSAISKGDKEFFSKPSLLYLLLFVALVPVGVLVFKKKQPPKNIIQTANLITLGKFNFYPEQHHLMDGEEIIPLSKKECELLLIFAEKPNQTISREELTKKVWEDNGVIVGRSLDTYISKLRKKLQKDESLQITNVHGVGYKLEVL